MGSPKPKVEVVLQNACSRLGEGPHWDHPSQTLLFVDILGQRVHRYNTTTACHDSKQLDGTVTPVVPHHQGGYVVGVGRRLCRLDWDSGELTTLQEVDPVPNTHLTDGKCDARGRLWAGTMGREEEVGYFAPEVGSLYCLGVDRSVTKHLSGITVFNGPVWSLDNRTMFFIDTVPGILYASDFDLDQGVISNQRTVVSFPEDDPGGKPDGMTIDCDGKLWIAFWDGSAVVKVDPETGSRLLKVPIPARQVSSVCWGGPNLDELYVTTARNFSDEEFQKQPLAGSLFKITGLGAKGLPANVYQG